MKNANSNLDYANQDYTNNNDDRIVLSREDWDAVNGRRFEDSSEDLKEEYTEDISEEELGDIKRFSAQNLYEDEQKESCEDDEDDFSEEIEEDAPRYHRPKRPSNSRIVNWWRNLSQDMKVMLCFTAALLFVFIVGILVIFTSMKTDTNSDIVLKDYKQTYELGDTVKVKLGKYIDKDNQPSTIGDSFSMYSTLFTNTSKYDYDSTTGIVKSKDKDYLEAGEYTITIQYTKDGTSKEKDVTFTVKDTKAPKFKDFDSLIYVVQNASNVDFSRYFEAEDLSNVTITTDAKESVDLSKVGKYEMKVTAKDSSKNKTTDKCTVHVISAQDVKNGKKLTSMKDGTIPMGSEDVSESTLKKNEERKKELQSAIETLKSQISEAESTIKSSQTNLNAINSQISKYEKMVNQEQSKLDKYQKAVTDAQTAIDNATQDDSMVDLEKKLTDAQYQYQQAQNNTKLYEYQQKLNELNDEAYYAQIQLSEDQSQIDQANSQLSTYEAELKSLQ
jgi:hypothetical protein